MEIREGYVQRITYRNETNGYSVIALDCDGDEEILTGIFPSISEGEYIRAEGETVVHPMYGEQLKVEKYEFVAPSDGAAMERYLSSGAVKGIGPALAKKIVGKFGDETFRVMEQEPERLSEVKGISERMAMEIAEQVIEKRELRSAMLFLQQYGISLQLASKIFKEYGQRLYGIVRENPYRLAEDISGVGFQTADAIARQMGIAPDSEYRVRSGVLYALQQSAGTGSTYLPLDELISATEDLLGTQVSEFQHLLQDLAMDKKLVIRRNGGETHVYLAAFFHMEADTAAMLRDMNIRDGSTSVSEIEGELRRMEKESGITLDGLQRSAVIESVRNGITVITGGPGTGKTTVINLIIRYFIRQGLDILLAAPTGRAAKRMSEATGYEAQTIHRLLEVNGDPSVSGGARFQKNEESPLEADVIIIDEMSMVDISLMHSLLKALVPGMRLILVGDVDQLPSVGPGEVLRDLIRSDCFPVVKLSRIYRQSEESDIVVNAHRINEGKPVEMKQSRDFIFIPRDNTGTIVGSIVTLLRDKLPPYVKAETRALQVLTPMRKGALGVENLNKMLQESLNPPSSSKIEKEFAFGIFREGDKVMQIKNDYQIEWEIAGTSPSERGTGVFNGDTGIIKWISHFDETVTVEFDEGKTVVYPFASCDELELAYAVTIHKSQGSEYPAVILPLFSGPALLMNRNLLYTGITRAKSCVCIVGKYETFASMIQNTREQQRYSGLRDMIRSLYGDA